MPSEAPFHLCPCGCGRSFQSAKPWQKYFEASCRKSEWEKRWLRKKVNKRTQKPADASERMAMNVQARPRIPVALRVYCLKLLLDPARTTSLERRVNLLGKKLGISARSIWRWIGAFRRGGINAVRDRLRSDTLTRRKVQP